MIQSVCAGFYCLVSLARGEEEAQGVSLMSGVLHNISGLVGQCESHREGSVLPVILPGALITRYSSLLSFSVQLLNQTVQQ